MKATAPPLMGGSAYRYAKAGLKIVEPTGDLFRVECRRCARQWDVPEGRHGRRLKGWWVCPSGCNAIGRTAEGRRQRATKVI